MGLHTPDLPSVVLIQRELICAPQEAGPGWVECAMHAMCSKRFSVVVLKVALLWCGCLQDGAERSAEGAPPALCAIPGRLHAHAALLDRHRVPARGLPQRPVQARHATAQARKGCLQFTRHTWTSMQAGGCKDAPAVKILVTVQQQLRSHRSLPSRLICTSSQACQARHESPIATSPARKPCRSRSGHSTHARCDSCRACLIRRVRTGQAPHPGLRRATEMALDCARGMQYLHARKCVPSLHALLHTLPHLNFSDNKDLKNKVDQTANRKHQTT